MVKLRLMRGGRKKRPYYRIVAAHSAFKRDGRFLERVGSYDPLGPEAAQIQLKPDRIIYWLEKGAQPTDTVHHILDNYGVYLRRELLEKDTDAETVESEVATFVEKRAAERAAKAEEAKLKAQAAKETENDPEPAAEEVESADVAEDTPAEEAEASEAAAEEEKKEA